MALPIIPAAAIIRKFQWDREIGTSLVGGPTIFRKCPAILNISIVLYIYLPSIDFGPPIVRNIAPVAKPTAA